MRRPGPATRRVYRLALLVATLLGIAVALGQASSDAGSLMWPSPRSVAAAFVLLLAALAFATSAWLALLPGRHGRSLLAAGFVLAQLGKYVPGGVLQVAQLYDLSRRAGIESRRVAVAMPVYALCVTVGPGALASVLFAIDATHLNALVRIAIVAMGLPLIVVSIARPFMAALLNSLSRRWTRVPTSASMPSQRAMLNCFALGLATGSCFGAAFSILLAANGTREQVLATLGFLLSFTVGFLAVPFPSGLGIREATLAAVLVGLVPIGTVLSAAVAARVLQLLAELTLAAIGATAIAWSRRDTRATRIDAS